MLQIIVIAALFILGLLSLSSYFAWFYSIELLTHFQAQYLVIALIRPATHVKIPSWFIPLLNIPIDHCLVSKDFGVVNTRISQNGNSDHAAIVVDLILRS